MRLVEHFWGKMRYLSSCDHPFDEVKLHYHAISRISRPVAPQSVGPTEEQNEINGLSWDKVPLWRDVVSKSSRDIGLETRSTPRLRSRKGMLAPPRDATVERDEKDRLPWRTSECAEGVGSCCSVCRAARSICFAEKQPGRRERASLCSV